jgi:hypothetical protein
LFCYIVSQLVGSTLALAYLPAESVHLLGLSPLLKLASRYVAPLGSSSLIFNFLFAWRKLSWPKSGHPDSDAVLVKTKITQLDILGGFVIIAGVVGVIVSLFYLARLSVSSRNASQVSGNHKSSEADDIEARLSHPVLQELWAKPAWIAYFVILELLTLSVYWLAHIFQSVWDERESLEEENAELNPEERYGLRSRRNEKPEGFWPLVWSKQRVAREWVKGWIARWTEQKPDQTVRKLLGFLWAFEAGILSGQTLIFGKSVCVFRCRLGVFCG